MIFHGQHSYDPLCPKKFKPVVSLQFSTLETVLKFDDKIHKVTMYRH